MSYGPGTNSGHGHVWPRPDGVKMRCGGPRICSACALDNAIYLDKSEGSAPTLAELRAFLDAATDWADTSTAQFTSSRGDQREGSSWRIELTETVATRSQR